MKTSLKSIMLGFTLLLAGCGGAAVKEPGTSTGGYLDSAYVSQDYRMAMDSIRLGSGVSTAELKQLQGYMREFRDSIQGHPTYRELLARAKGLEKMREGGVEMRVSGMSLHHVQKQVEVRLVLTFMNTLSMPLGGLRGEVHWLDEQGKKVATSPSFSVQGPIAAGDSISGLRLEYALYKPTGNELNDPRNQAARETLEAVEAIAKLKNLGLFRFKLLDIQLVSGLSPGQYWLRTEEERRLLDHQPLDAKAKPLPLLQWVEAHEDWITKLHSHSSEYGLMISPVITPRVEAGHGKNLVLDRTAKVFAFFHEQKRIPKSNINRSIAGKRLVLASYIDYWNWPMEIRIYKQ